MRIRRGAVWAKVLGDTWEFQMLAKRLAVDPTKPSLLSDYEFPAGLLPRVLDWCYADGIEVEVIDDRPAFNGDGLIEGLAPDILNGITLRDYQLMTAKKLLLRGTGVAELPTGAGKTEILAAIVYQLLLNGFRHFVCLVDRQFLVENIVDRFERRGLGDLIDIGRFGDGQQELDCGIVVGTIASFHSGLKRSNMEVLRCLRRAEVVLLDEAHHVAAKTWARVAASTSNANLRFGMTATVYEDFEDVGYEELLLEGLVGELAVQIPGYALRARGVLADTRACFLTVRDRPLYCWEWQNVLQRGIIEHQLRNSIIQSLVLALWRLNRRMLVFVNQKSHGRGFLRVLHRLGVSAVFVQGGGKVQRISRGELLEMQWSLADLKAYVDDKSPSVVISTQVLDEGIDVPAFDTVILAGGGKKRRRTLQRIGRGMRPKELLLVFDFRDEHHKFLERHSEARAAAYERERIPVLGLDEVAQLLGGPIDLVYDLPFTPEGVD